MTDVLKVLIDKGYIEEEDLKIKFTKVRKLFSSFEKQTQDEVINVYYTTLESIDDTISNKKKEELKENIILIKDDLIELETISNCFVLFRDMYQERKTLEILLSSCNDAKERKAVNDFFSFIIPIYTKVPPLIKLKVDQEGINYLEYNTYAGLDNKENISAKVYNLSMKELKNLYNYTGVNLFKLNVRVGIQNKKAGKELKEEFKTYLKVGILNSEILEDEKDEVKEYFSLNDLQINQYKPELFWYKHNGVNIFVDDDSKFEIESEHILLNPEKVSVINGAQTLTNLFLSQEELLEDLNGFSGKKNYNFEEILNEVLGDIFVKTIFIKGKHEISQPITWGLNNQIPIHREDFIGVSKEVDDLNKLLKKYQLKILKTGEIEKIYTGITPLAFVKLFLIADNKPGSSKNFNKINLGIKITEALSKINQDHSFLDKIVIAFEVENWWNSLSKNTKEKNIFLRYGKNYFQSYVIYNLIKENRLESFMENDFESYFKEMEHRLNEMNVEVNDFKKDEKYNLIIKKINLQESNKNNKNIDKNDNIKELTEFIKKNQTNNYSVSSLIKKFNAENSLSKGYFRTISMINGETVKEHFPLPNSTFEEFYKRDGYMNDNNYPIFEESLFLKELKREYPIYVICLNNQKEIENIKFIKHFSLAKGLGWKENAEKVFEDVKKGFIAGDMNLFPKISSNKKYHVRPKAINSNDTFQFTNGKEITKRTFWANAKFIKEIIDILESNSI